MPSGSFPTGTITFLFTDIEGSTKMWEAHPDTMRASLARHDTLMREAIGASNGYVFKTIGDAFCAAFATAAEAVECVLNAQLALTAEPWPLETPIKVRMALHTGAVESRDDDYFGPPVNRVARLLSTAHGGQSVLSQTTYDLVRDDLPAVTSLRSLGEHRLKDLGRPEVIFQLLHLDLPDDFPPLRSLDNPELKHNLPQQVTSFVGREAQISEVKGLLEKTRLLTLTGAGGSGKTRLALQVAADMVDGSCDGVWLVELAPLTEPGLVASTVANTLALKEEPGKPILQTLTEHLKSKHPLLLLDNCEHLMDACAKLADTILRNCPKVQILATSREGLGISGETTYRVPSLSLPDPRQPQTPESLSHYEAVRLFIDRAAQVQTTFAVTNQNAPALASICQRLDGIPLALELAAARVRSLSVDEINSRLDQRFRLLTGGSRTALPRQQTLRSLIDWSYDLLNEPEKALLCQLSVFLGGWTLEAAEGVCSGKPVEEWETLGLLTSLGDKSLVVSETYGSSSRFHLLETIRQYSLEKLEETSDSETVRRAHRDYFLSFAEEAEPQLQGPEQAIWLNRLEADHENIRMAMDWSKSEGNVESVFRFCAALGRYWCTRGYLSEGRQLCEQALLEVDEGRTLQRARVLNCAARVAYYQGDPEASKWYLEECLAISREIGEGQLTALALNGLGLVAAGEGEYVLARMYLKEALNVSRERGDLHVIAMCLNNLGNNEEYAGDYAAAMAYLQEGLSVSRQIGYTQNTGSTLYNLGNVARLSGDYASAQTWLQQCLAISQDIGYRLLIAESLEALANLMGVQQHMEFAARLWGAGEALREVIGSPMPADDQVIQEGYVSQGRSEIGEEAFAEAWAEGRALTMEQAIELALNAGN